MKILGKWDARLQWEEKRRGRSGANAVRARESAEREAGGLPEAQAGVSRLSREERARLWGSAAAEERPELPKPDRGRSGGGKEKTETESRIIVKPDGSRVLLMTVRRGGAVIRAMSLKLSEPSPDTEEAGKAAETEKTEGAPGAEAAGRAPETEGTGTAAGAADTGRTPETAENGSWKEGEAGQGQGGSI